MGTNKDNMHNIKNLKLIKRFELLIQSSFIHKAMGTNKDNMHNMKNLKLISRFELLISLSGHVFLKPQAFC